MDLFNVDLSNAVLRERAYHWCGANQTTYSEWTVDELTTAFIALRDTARAEQRETDAKIAESVALEKPHPRYNHFEDKHGAELVREIATAIRSQSPSLKGEKNE